MHLRKKEGVLTNLACGLLAFSMTLGFFLSCRRFSVALRMVGALGNGYLGLYVEIGSTVGLSQGPNPGSGSSEARLRVNYCFVS